MHFTYLFVVVVFSFLLLLLRQLLSPLRHVPGPSLTRFTKAWYFRQIWAGNFHKTNIELHQKHGKFVRTAPNEYSIDDPDAVKIIYGLGSQFPKADWCKHSPAFVVPNFSRLTKNVLRLTSYDEIGVLQIHCKDSKRYSLPGAFPTTMLRGGPSRIIIKCPR